MAAFHNSACLFLWAVFLLSFADAAPAPVAEGDLAQSQALDLHTTEAGSSRCYYNFQHYEEGDRIITNEPCLNCTCHKRMLMCYLRVCPFTKPVGQDCTVEKKPDQCCPVITCPEVPVDIVTSSTTEASASSYSSSVGHVGKYGCTLEDNTFYPDGVQMPSDPKKPCELCYCIRNHTACVRQECTLNVEGCRPVYQDGVCCPVRYDCDYNEISTTEKPSTGGLLLGTTASPAQQCHYEDTVYNDGELIETDKPCESCYCMRGDIVCAVRSCGEPMEGKNCHALPPPDGQCCPTTFQCENGTISIENIATESSIIMHPSPMGTDLSTKGPEPQVTAGEASDSKKEEIENEEKETTSSTEMLPSTLSQGNENQEDKDEEEKVEDHPDEHIQSEPTDSDDFEDEEALISHSESSSNLSEPQSPDVSEHITSAPDVLDEVITQSSIVPEVNTLEESAAPIVEVEGTELNQKEKDGTNQEQESIKDKVKPDDSESAGTEEENTTGANESVSEKQDIVTEKSENSEEISENKPVVNDGHEISESIGAEVVTQSGEYVHPEQDTIPAIVENEKEYMAPTASSGDEKSPFVPTGGESTQNIDNAEDSKLEVEQDETKTESNQIMPGEKQEQQEKENETSTANENEIKYEETPSKTPESLDQVKEQEISQDKVVTSTDGLPGIHTNEETTEKIYHDKQEENSNQEKEVMEANPQNPNVDGTESSIHSGESNPEHSEHFHKEQAPPRKEDASPEEIEQRPQHPEGSMTKAEDSIPDGQELTEDIVTELPGHKENLEESNKVQQPDNVEKTPIDATESSMKHDDANENIHEEGPKDEQVQESSSLQTEEPITNEASTEHGSGLGINQISEDAKHSETNEPKDDATELSTHTDASDIINENGGVETIETKPSEIPSSEKEPESESVPTVIVIEPENESDATNTLPEESNNGEVKPEVVSPQDTNHDSSSDHEDDHQSIQTERPLVEEEETTLKETNVPTENEKQPVGDNVENENIPLLPTESSSEISSVEDGTKKETITQTPMHEMNPSSVQTDTTASSTNLEKETDNETDHDKVGGNANDSEGKLTTVEVLPSEEGAGSVSTPETSMPEKEESGQSHSDTTGSEGLTNEIKHDEDAEHKDDTPTEPSVEESTDSLVKTGSESKPEEIDNENKGEESESTIKPEETADNLTSEDVSPSGGIHHDPVESEPTEFDDNDFEETGDHDSTSENEIIDDHLSGHGGAIDHETPSIMPGPVGVIPGEGDCLVDGQTYTNNSIIPSKSPCHKECTCLSSIVHCQGIDCPPPPPELANCMPVHQGDLCCPVYTCDGNTPEGPQSHNQMGGNEENVKGTEDQKLETISSEPPTSESEIKNEKPEEAITPTDKSETPIITENVNNESETQKESDESTNKEGAGFQTDMPFVEDILANSEKITPNNILQTTENSISVIEKEDISTSLGTSFEEHKDESSDDKLSVESVTTKVNTPEEVPELKPDSEAESSENNVVEKEKETQHGVLTDQSEAHEADSDENIPTETPIVVELPSQAVEKPDDVISSGQDSLSTLPSDNEEQQKPEVTATEISQTSMDETHDADEQSEPNVELVTLETGSKDQPEIADGNLPTVTENVAMESTDSSPGDHISHEDIQPDKGTGSDNIVPSVGQTEASTEHSEEAHISDGNPSENENTKVEVQEIVTETQTDVSQVEVVKQNNEVTQEPSQPEVIATSKPSEEETDQHSEGNETHDDIPHSESEDQSKPIEDSKPQTITEESDLHMNLVTESSTQGSNPEEEVSPPDTEGGKVSGEEEASPAQKPFGENDVEGLKHPDEEHKIVETLIETVNPSAETPDAEENQDSDPSNATVNPSAETPDAEENQDSDPSNAATASSIPNTEETDAQKIPAPEGAIHDDSIDEQNEEITEGTIESHHGLSTQAPSFDGPSTAAPTFEIEHHGEETPLEGADNVETSIATEDTKETVDTPASDNLVVGDKHATSTVQETTQEQSSENSLVSQDENYESENEPQTTGSPKPSGSETSESTNEVEEGISELPGEEVEQPVPSQPSENSDTSGQESSESIKPEQEHHEEETTQKAEDDHEEVVVNVHSNEDAAHSTEIPLEQNTNEDSDSVHEESELVNEGGESSNGGIETTTKPITPVHEEAEQESNTQVHEDIHEDPEQVHEESDQAHEDNEPALEENVTVHEESEQDNEDQETPQEEIETNHVETEPHHEEDEQVQEENEPNNAESVHEGEMDHDQETATYVNEVEQSTLGTDLSENASQEPESGVEHAVAESEHPVLESEEPSESEHSASEVEHTDSDHPVSESELPASESEHPASESEHPASESEHPASESEPPASESEPPASESEPPASESETPVLESEHPALESEHSDSESEHTVIEPEHTESGSDHVIEPDHPTHETEHPSDENTIGDGEHPALESEQGAHEAEHIIHETDIPHTQDIGSLPNMPGATHAIDNAKPQNNKPDDPELPPEDQFTPDVEMDYDVSEDGAFGPGTCRYGGKVYVSAQQIPRDDPCDFCFCFRSDIICLQQSCPPPIHRCHQEPIQGYCCPRYQCPVSMATSLNITTTTSTTTTTLPPHFFAHAYRGAARQSGCFHRGRAYEVGEEITSASGPCLQCICGSDGQMRCDPKVCNPEPMVRKLMEAAVSHRRR